MVEHYAAGEGQGEDAPKVSHLCHFATLFLQCMSPASLPHYLSIVYSACHWPPVGSGLHCMSCYICTIHLVIAVPVFSCLYAHSHGTLRIHATAVVVDPYALYT